MHWLLKNVTGREGVSCALTVCSNCRGKGLTIGDDRLWFLAIRNSQSVSPLRTELCEIYTHTRPCSASHARVCSWLAVIAIAGHEHRHPLRVLFHLKEPTYSYDGSREHATCRSIMTMAGRQVVKGIGRFSPLTFLGTNLGFSFTFSFNGNGKQDKKRGSIYITGAQTAIKTDKRSNLSTPYPKKKKIAFNYNLHFVTLKCSIQPCTLNHSQYPLTALLSPIIAKTAWQPLTLAIHNQQPKTLW